MGRLIIVIYTALGIVGVVQVIIADSIGVQIFGSVLALLSALMVVLTVRKKRSRKADR